VRVPDVTIGSHVFNRVIMELSEAEEGYFANSLYVGNLGGELWRRFTVTLDYTGRQMYLAPNDAFDQPFDGPKSGLAPPLVDGMVKIVDVVDGSPAAEAGMQAGEAILAVNDVSTDSQQGAATRASLDRVTQALRAAPGSRCD
jgi:membrane-associated protease RseP (regulator of RpoE activity)